MSLAAIVVGILIAFVALVFFISSAMGKKKNSKKEINYYTLFVMGMCFMPLGVIGIATENYGFMGLTGLGVVYMAAGLSHRNEWPQNKKIKIKKPRKRKKKK